MKFVSGKIIIDTTIEFYSFWKNKILIIIYVTFYIIYLCFCFTMYKTFFILHEYEINNKLF